jgi:hypothetical protein
VKPYRWTAGHAADKITPRDPPERAAGILRHPQSDPVASAKALAEVEKSVAESSLAAFEQDLKGWISEMRGRVKAAQEEFKGRFGAALEERLKDLGLKLHGNFPLLTASFFRIRIDPEAGAVRLAYGPDEEPLGKVDPDPDKVAKAVQDVLRDLDSLRVSDGDFLERLRAAYERCLKTRDLRSGEKVGILDALREYVWLIQSRRFAADPRRENFIGYSRVHFSYHLSKLQSRKRLELTVAAREQASRKEEHLWVPTDDRGNGTHFAYLAFHEP